MYIVFNLAFSHALACEDIRLDKDPSVLGRVPAWDQGKNGTCWAFSATQLIDAWRFSTGDKDFKHLTSPLMVAVDGVGNDAGTYEWGNVVKAAKTVREKGSCNAKWVSDHLGIEKANQVIENLEAIHSLTKPVVRMSDSIDLMIKNPSFSSNKMKDDVLKGLPKFEISPGESSRSKAEAAEKCSQYLTQIGVEDKIAPGVGAIQAALEQDRVGFTKEILSFICKDTKPMRHLPDLQYTFPPDSEPQSTNRNAQIQRLLDEKLKSKKPTAINFCYSGVINKVSEVHPIRGARCDDNSDHYAVIVGSSKKAFGKCEYLVRDSYCSQYEKKTRKKVCKDGQHWMTAEQLMKNTMGLIHF